MHTYTGLRLAKLWIRLLLTLATSRNTIGDLEHAILFLFEIKTIASVYVVSFCM